MSSNRQLPIDLQIDGGVRRVTAWDRLVLDGSDDDTRHFIQAVPGQEPTFKASERILIIGLSNQRLQTPVSQKVFLLHEMDKIA